MCFKRKLQVYKYTLELNSVTKIFVITVKGLKPVPSCVRDQNATTAPARHMWDTGSLNWAQFMLQWFIRFNKFAECTEFNESSAPFRKNPIGLFVRNNMKCSDVMSRKWVRCQRDGWDVKESYCFFLRRLSSLGP